ncbi:hypothetical protein JYK02_38210 [Corallococcus macrosporus]|uniref:Transglutaminase-like domain-containing protein n=1 Tax=Corallococcus macrosporus TaxID=35 RepID=A0ABS3DPU6_9BACT|nr:transglutaminase domain-containing protein [Corallococcus macrosporus]MBN8233368.1 hypothetical protein [Corallococcus macrosporus]
MQQQLREASRQPGTPWMRALSMAVTVAMVFLSLRPMAAAAETEARQAQAHEAWRARVASASSADPAPSFLASLQSASTTGQRCSVASLQKPVLTAEEQHSQRLDAVAELAKRARPGALRTGRAHPVAALRAKLDEAASSGAALEASFASAEQTLKDAKLPSVLLERHRAAVKEARARQAQLLRLARQLDRADDAGLDAERARAVEAVVAFFDQHPQGEKHRPTPPGPLPFRSPEPTKRLPATSSQELPPALTRLAAKSSSLARTGVSAAPADTLTATEDVQLTPAIVALAAQLHHHPVELYNWVRNHIEWVPTYGSIQGSDLTLLNRRGNAFDTASLLIALYRASGIPARYVYGSIDVPTAQMLNWVGNVTRVEAAQQLLSQGGIPATALVQDGAIRAVRMEHVWVEAQVDFEPSRGAVHHTPDTWVPVDASFKQYSFPARVDVRAALPQDVQAETQKIVANVVKDPATGSVTGLDQVAYDAWLTTMREDANDRFGSQPSLEDFTGRRVILPETAQVLAGTLPYAVVARSQSFARLPDALRHQVQLTLYASAFDRMTGDASLTWTVDLPSLAGRRLGVTYVPASAADAAALAAYRAAPGDSLPLYQLNVRPVIQIDGVDQAQGPGGRMGEDQTWEARFLSPGDPGSEPVSFDVTAGEEMVFGIDGQGVTQEMIHARFQKQPSDTAAENLHTVALYYWAQYDALNEAVAAARDARVVRLPSIGLFSVPLSIQYYFGIPRLGSYSSRQMDVARSLIAVVDRAGGPTAEVHRLTGTFASLLEGRTFDALFQREPGSGVSAVQLLRDANTQNIPIYRITAANYAQIAPRLDIDADVAQEIANAVQAGQHVVVSERAPAHGNWSGLGYIIEDPDNGTAAYLIKGGLNGGADNPCNRERAKEPQRVPVLEIVLVAILIIALILLLLMLPEILIAIGGALEPAFASLMVFLGLGAAPAMAATPPPGAGMSPPGDCTSIQHRELKRAVGLACKSVPFSCASFPNTGANCLELANRRNLGLACAAARQAINDTCFRGGDAAHIDELSKAFAAVATCECKLIANGCPP